MDMRSNKVMSGIIAFAMVLMAMVIVLPATTQAAWPDDATMSFAPTEMFPGNTYTASYTLNINSIDSGVTQLTISNVWIQYEWESAAHDILATAGARTVSTFTDPVIFTSSVQVPASQGKGDYTVNATVWAYTNGDPSTLVTHKYTGTVTVSDPITAVPTATPTTGFAPQAVDFDVTASGGAGGFKYSWDFGDGSAAATQKNPSHTYTAGGTFTAKVTVSDNLGQSVVVSAPAVVIAPGITVTINAQPSSGPFPLDVKFTGSVTDAASGDLTYLWNFGDGATSTEASPTHTYAKAGNYNANLTVTDSSARTGKSSDLAVRVTASVNPVAAISASVDHGRGPLAVDFMSTVDGGTPSYSYLWSFGDGSTSTQANPSHTFNDPGVYIVRLTVTDSASRSSSSQELTITVVSDTSMRVIITASEVKGTSPMAVSFNSTILDGTAPYFYRWSFGDGVNSTQANPTHIYEKAGSYKVTLTVTDSNSNVTIAQYGLDGADNLTIVVSEPAAAEIPSWVWIWGITGITIVAVGAIGLVMMRRQRK